MILQSTDALEEYVGNKYSLVILAAKRARQLKEGHSPLSRENSDNKLSIALREIHDQKLRPEHPPEEEIAPAPRDVITSLVTGAEFDLDEDLDLDEGDAVDDLAALLVGGGDEDEEEEEADAETGVTPVAAVDDDTDDDADEDEADEDDAETDDTLDTDEEADEDE